MIRFMCPQCNMQLSAGGRQGGLAVNCPGCGIELTVPTREPPPRALTPIPERIEPPIRFVETAETESEPEELHEPAAGNAVEATEPAAPPEHPLYAPLPASSTTDYGPPPRRFGFFSFLFGTAGAILFGMGTFYPLIMVNNEPIGLELWRQLLLYSGSVGLGICALVVTWSKRYAGLWVLGPGALLALGGGYAFFHLVHIQESVKAHHAALSVLPGTGYLMLGGGAALLTLAALVRPKTKRYEYSG